MILIFEFSVINNETSELWRNFRENWIISQSDYFLDFDTFSKISDWWNQYIFTEAQNCWVHQKNLYFLNHNMNCSTEHTGKIVYWVNGVALSWFDITSHFTVIFQLFFQSLFFCAISTGRFLCRILGLEKWLACLTRKWTWIFLLSYHIKTFVYSEAVSFLKCNFE